MRLSRLSRTTLAVVAGLILVIVYVPLGVVLVNSFSTSTSLSWPPPGFTLEWWQRAFQSAGAMEAVGTSVFVAMQESAVAQHYERAARWRERFEQLEWLLAATARSRAAVDLLTFVYRDPGVFGDDRAYLVRRGTVRACFPYPTTPIERIAFGAVVKEELGREEPATGPLPLEAIDEILLLMSWFRTHPEALKRTVPLEEWEG